MARPVGYPKSGGRKAGTKNKDKESIEQICARKGVNPLEVLLDLCKDEDKAMRLSAAREVCQYLLPKKRAMDVVSNQTINQTTNLTDSTETKKHIDELKELVSNIRNEQKQTATTPSSSEQRGLIKHGSSSDITRTI